VGRWSGRVAPLFLDWLEIPAGGVWLDVGCGTGALTAAILEHAAPRAVTGIDRSEAYVEYARARIRDTRARFEIGDAQGLTAASGSCDSVVSGLVLNFVPEPDRMIAEMTRAVRAQGSVAVYVWDYAGGMEMLRRFWDAAIALDPAAARLDEANRFAICAPGPLEDLLLDARLRDVATHPLDAISHFRSFEDFWSPFLGGQGPAAGYLTSLGEDHRDELGARIRADLPFGADGSIVLRARAWAVRGVKN
jgi:SAM-dependent methyltransferase